MTRTIKHEFPQKLENLAEKHYSNSHNPYLVCFSSCTCVACGSSLSAMASTLRITPPEESTLPEARRADSDSLARGRERSTRHSSYVGMVQFAQKEQI